MTVVGVDLFRESLLASGGKTGRLIAERDWSGTPLGPLETWSQSLRSTLSLILASAVPMVVLWGPESIRLYNDGYAAIAGGRHPELLGSRVREGWPEVAGFTEHAVRASLAGGTLAYRDLELTLDRNGRPETVNVNLDYSPVLGANGEPAGVLAIVNETTPHVMAEQRQSFLSELDNHLRMLVDPPAITTDAAELLGHYLGVGRAGYGEIDASGEVVSVAQDWSQAPMVSLAGEARILDAFGPEVIAELRAGRTLVVEDCRTDPRTSSPDYLSTWDSIATRALIVSPLVSAERLAAIFYAHSSAPRLWSPLEMALVEDVAARTWAAVQRARAEAKERKSEEQLQLATEAAELGIFDVDLVTLKMDWDPRQRALWGVGLDEVITDELFILGIHPEDRGWVREVIAQAFKPESDGLYAAEYRVRPHDGSAERWVAATGRVHFERERPVRLVGTVQDITARKRTEAALRESEARLRDLNETLERQVAERSTEFDRVWRLSRDLLVIVDAEGILRAVNPAWEMILGYQPDEVVRRSFLEFVWPEDIDRALNDLRGALANPEISNIEMRYRHRDGTPRWISWLTSVEGELVYAYGRDVTTEKARQAELEQAQEQLRQSQKLDAMGQLTGGVAHDFNNLLTPIIASLDMLLRRGVGSERERRLMDGALQSAERAKVLVQRLLAFARRQPLQPGPVDVRRLVSDMAELIASTSGPRIDVRVDLPDDLPPALADANQLEMAVLNLAVNARDAMPDAGVLTISAARESVRGRHPAKLRDGHYVRLSVKDTGIGMDEATLTRAVEPFFSTKGIGKGTGLGLSMVHGLASQLGGGLTITSSPGEGTTVNLWLPISSVAVEEDEGATKAGVTPKALGTALLVDDEDLVRMSTTDMLMDLGYEVVEATSAEEALRLVEEGLQPDLVVTDHLMPGMSGLDLARDLRSRRPDLPVLIISGYAEMEGVAAGFPRLAKPFRSAELAAGLAALLPERAE